MKKTSNKNTLQVLARHLTKDIQSGKVELYHLPMTKKASAYSFREEARSYARSTLKFAQTPWYMNGEQSKDGFESTPEQNPYLDETVTTNDSEDLGEGNPVGNDGLQSDIFGSTYANPQGNDVQAAIQTSIMGLKDTVFNLAKSLYGFDLSEEDSMKIVKESLKNMSSKIADIPIDAYVQKIDSYLDGGSKTTTKTPGSPNDTTPTTPPEQAPVDATQTQAPVETATEPQAQEIPKQSNKAKQSKQSMILTSVQGVTKTAIDWNTILVSAGLAALVTGQYLGVFKPLVERIKRVYGRASAAYNRFEIGYEGEFGNKREFTLSVLDELMKQQNFSSLIDEALSDLDNNVCDAATPDDALYSGKNCLDEVVSAIAECMNERLDNDLDPQAIRDFLLDEYEDRYQYGT